MYCPNCGSEVRSDAVQCEKCDATFGSGAAWKPMVISPIQILADRRGDLVATTQQMSFSGRVLALFILVGPLVALLVIGPPTSSLVLAFIPAVYTIGGVLAFMAWVLFSGSFALLAVLETKDWIPSAVFSPPSLVILAAFFGGASGYLAWTSFTCSSGSWVLGGWAQCLKWALWREYGFSVLPGSACGVASVLLWHKREA